MTFTAINLTDACARLQTLSEQIAMRVNNVNSYVPRDMADRFPELVARIHRAPGGRDALLALTDWHQGPMFDERELDLTLEDAADRNL